MRITADYIEFVVDNTFRLTEVFGIQPTMCNYEHFKDMFGMA